MVLEAFCSEMVFTKYNTNHIQVPVLDASILRKSNYIVGLYLGSSSTLRKADS